jgi:tripartite-type tricarboxylate transporter receptor subunit TctC
MLAHIKWRIVFIAALALFGATAAAHAAEVKYPTRPIRIIVPYPPGGSTDPTARAFGNWFSEKFGVPVVIDNRPGAGATIGHGLAAKATPDGYTLLLGTSGGLVSGPAFGTKISYDPVKDYAPVGLAVYAPFLLVVHPSIAAKNPNELIDLAKAQPGKINFASPGTGTPNHLGIELLTAMAGAKFTHVPYKGGGPAMIDLVGGRVQALFGSIPYVQPQVLAGRIRAIAVGHPKRVRFVPELPAIAETLPGFNNTTWFGLLAPVGTPAAIVNKLNAEMKNALANAEFAKQFEALGLEAAAGTPKEFGEVIRTELARWTKVIRDAGIQAN